MKYLFAEVLVASSFASFSAANAAGGCGPGWHRGPYGGCQPNRGGVVVVNPAPRVVVAPPVVVLSQTFPARPSSIPEIRDFVSRGLAESPLTEQENQEVRETVFRALLDAAGPTGG